mmetsp:Transcript_28371/g.69481  ORF Transcript_28371/g.69481 Transcript_28371/m.69481 type:complete len:204 (-) Transcript_28371:200-811(-)
MNIYLGLPLVFLLLCRFSPHSLIRIPKREQKSRGSTSVGLVHRGSSSSRTAAMLISQTLNRGDVCVEVGGVLIRPVLQSGKSRRSQRPWWQFDGWVIRDSNIPRLFSCFYPVRGITLWPFIFLVSGADNDVVINHEKIHIVQANESLILGMYIVWLWDFGTGLVRFGSAEIAYQHIRLEREAHDNENDMDYLDHRPPWAWVSY